MQWCSTKPSRGQCRMVRIPQFTYFGDGPLSIMAIQKQFILYLVAPALIASILIGLGSIVSGLFLFRYRNELDC